MKRISKVLAVLLGVMVTLAGCGSKQVNWDKYPEKPINLIISYAPGGGSDVMFNALKPFILLPVIQFLYLKI